MSSGFFLGKEGSYIEKSEKSKGSISMIAKGGNAEVFIQEVLEGETVIIEPGGPNLMEFLYILEGFMHYTNTLGEVISLGPNDYFYVNKLKNHVMLETDSKIKLIYFSTEPVFHYLSETIKEFVNMAKKVEDKDHYTRGHLDRVGEYALKISKKLGFTAEEIEQIGYAAVLHDLGKVNVPESILNKVGKLTVEEFDVIKKHSYDGANIVKDTYYENLSAIIHQHHEKVDGSGYPEGLKGDEILLEARIISVADAYDAMTTDRPYRNGMSKVKAIEELRAYRGKHFDSKVVDTFVELLKEEKD